MTKNLSAKGSLKLFMTMVLAMILSGCAVKSSEVNITPPTKVIQRSREVEESKIYSRLLNEYISGGNPILIDSATLTGTFIDDEIIRRLEPSVNQETLTGFRLANHVSKILDLSLSLNRDYLIVAYRDRADWDIQVEKYPYSDLTVAFSSIGFDEQLEQALVYVEQFHDGDDGRGDLYFFTYQHEWKLENVIYGWIS